MPLKRPAKSLCRGSASFMLGPDEPTGTVMCGVCHNITLRMKTVVNKRGQKVFMVPDHYLPK